MLVVVLQMGSAGDRYPEGEPRFSLLATIQEFGREHLEAVRDDAAAEVIERALWRLSPGTRAAQVPSPLTQVRDSW
jgi:hypothetical protein